MVTPLNSDGSLDFKATEILVEHLISGGVHGIFVLGTTGEAQGLSAEQRADFATFAGQKIAGRVPYIVGVSDTSIADSVALAKVAHDLVGGSADLEPSNKTGMKEYGWLAAGDFSGRNIHFGIRELAMSAIVNGITAYGGYRAFGATFFVFSDYCRPAIRLAALMKLPSIWVFSHDSFYVGEDGPTHEPVEQLAAMRTMPNVATFRPADANETGYCWVEMLKNTSGPSCILTTRQNLPILEGTSAEGVSRGAYTIYENSAHPEYLFLASGSEVSLCIEAAKMLADTGRSVRVVSMPCRELFERQSLEYRESVVPGTCTKRIIVEAGVKFGWGRYVADESKTRFVTLDTYGDSAPYKVLAEQFGFTAENVLAKAKELY